MLGYFVLFLSLRFTVIAERELNGTMVCFQVKLSGGLFVSGTVLFNSTFNSVPLSGLAFSNGNIEFSYRHGTFVLPNAKSSSNEPLPKTILSNCTGTSGTAHGNCTTTNKRL